MSDEKKTRDADNNRTKDDFWDLGSSRERKYAKHDFSGHTIEATDIIVEAFSDLQDALSDLMETAEEQSKEEKIVPRKETTEAEGKTISPSFWRDPIGGGRIPTSSYKRHATKGPASSKHVPATGRSLGDIVSVCEKRGTLIKKIEVRSWNTETEFYGRFTSDAVLSHRLPSVYPVDAVLETVPYFSYVPQYAHMNKAQLDYYRYVRENIRASKTVKCDLAYLQLYIYEIFNIPAEIPPAEGAHLLARIWIGYRKEYPRLDGYLSEWLPDYCMINDVPLPEELVPILDEITPKAQFKEFFLDAAMEHGCAVGAIVAETVSDYDYKSSRYYRDNTELFDRHIPTALSAAISSAIERGVSVFSLDREYKMVRDSYCGAIAASAVKRRIDVEFCSFSRRADARIIVTDMVKYTENKVRQIAGIKSRLSAERLDASLAAMIDKYFEPFAPAARRSAEDKYMPADYLKNYEAEDSGFDFSRASDIERNSWANTDRLTGEKSTERLHDTEEIAHNGCSFATSDAYEPSNHVDGEIVFGRAEKIGAEAEGAPHDEADSAADGIIKDALRAALGGNFGEYCRSAGVIDGDMAERVNTRMLDVLGDVALEYTGEKYELIEDYREDIEGWL